MAICKVHNLILLGNATTDKPEGLKIEITSVSIANTKLVLVVGLMNSNYRLPSGCRDKLNFVLQVL